MLLFRIMTAYSCVAGSVIQDNDLSQLQYTESLVSFTMNNCQFPTGAGLGILRLENNDELVTLNLTGCKGLAGIVPDKWRKFTVLKNLYLGNCGFNSSQIDAIIQSLKIAIEGGMMRATTIPRTILLNGLNAPPTAASASDKAAIIAFGINLTTN